MDGNGVTYTQEQKYRDGDRDTDRDELRGRVRDGDRTATTAVETMT